MSKVWKIAPGQGAKYWELFRGHDCIGLGWLRGYDYRNLGNEKQILRTLRKVNKGLYKGASSGAASMIWQFANRLRVGDIVVANKGYKKVLGIGVITGGYIPTRSKENTLPKDKRRQHIRKVEWIVNREVTLRKSHFFVQATLRRLNLVDVEKIQRAYLNKYPNDARLRASLNRLFGEILVEDKKVTPKKLVERAEKQSEREGVFDPDGIRDARRRVAGSIVLRRGQPAFRRKLLDAYGKCAITGCVVEPVLEASHIIPYQGDATDHPTNGLLLRADLHTLFDLQLIAFDEEMKVIVSPDLRGSEYWKYRDTKIADTNPKSYAPNGEAIKKHRKESGL
jgi:hypothetical protein